MGLPVRPTDWPFHDAPSVRHRTFRKNATLCRRHEETPESVRVAWKYRLFICAPLRSPRAASPNDDYVGRGQGAAVEDGLEADFVARRERSERGDLVHLEDHRHRRHSEIPDLAVP